MRKFGVLALAATLVMAPQAFAVEVVAKVESQSGSATAVDAAGATRDLAVDGPVFMGDRVATGPGSRMLLRFVDNTTAGLGENAELVINQYVFTPASKDGNRAAFRALKGVIRFVTDQITKLSPENFSVEANYGTIGIRGCDVGLSLDAERDNVFIIGLTGDEAIFIELNEDHRAGQDTTSLLVREAGVKVGISPLGLTQGTFDPSELRNLLNLAAGQMEQDRGSESAESDGEGSGEAGSDSWAGADEPPSDAPSMDDIGMDEAGTEAPADVANDAVSDVPLAPQDEETIAQSDPDEITGESWGEGGGEADAAPDEEPAGEDTSEADSGDSDHGDDGGMENPADEITTSIGDPYSVRSGSGQDWSWGIWGRDVTTTLPDGTERVTTRYDKGIDGDFITESEQFAIATGTQLYHLSGSGPASAAVTYKDQGTIFDGNASFHVAIGAGISPTWDGTFVLGNATEGLTFTASGAVNTDGSVSSQDIQNYNLNAFGFNLPMPPPDPADRVVSGSLVGPGSGTDPISGIVVDFLFKHPNGPTVVGAGGADLH
jgi:hypothetical protein